MTSSSQRIANRANAAKSTGPKTPEGKQIVGENAFRHGCRATTLLIEGEDEELFTALRLALMEELEPESVLEMQLADQFIALVWRSRRIATFEAAILAWMGHWSGEYYDVSGHEKGWNGRSERIQRFHNGLTPKPRSRSEEANRQLRLGRLLHEEMSHNLIAKLSRYESHLLTQLRRTHADLLDQQTRRMRREATQGALPRIDEQLAAEARAETVLPYGTAPPPYGTAEAEPQPSPRAGGPQIRQL